MKFKVSKGLLSLALFLVLALFLFCVIFPFVWLVVSSFMTSKELGEVPPHWLPREPTIQNYASVILGKYNQTRGGVGSLSIATPIVPSMLNSLYISAIVAFYNVLIGGLAAYSMSRFRTRLNRMSFMAFLALRIVPPISLVFPFFVIFRHLRLINTSLALIISYNVFLLPLCIWLLKSYFDKLPVEIEEMALIEGLGRFRAYFRIVVPISFPGLIAVFIMAFLESWSEFFYAIVLTDQLTFPTVLIGYRSLVQLNWNSQAAAAVVTAIPPIVLVMILQKHIIAGLTAGAVKG